MKRTIKFRAWDDEAKEMIYPHKSPYKPHHQWHTNEDTIVYANMQNGFTTSTIMQFTGLHDRNGKEIYEGDIVKWTDSSDAVSFGCDPSCGGYATEVEEEVWYGGGAFYPVCNMPSDNFEVIGNIYENNNP